MLEIAYTMYKGCIGGFAIATAAYGMYLAGIAVVTSKSNHLTLIGNVLLVPYGGLVGGFFGAIFGCIVPILAPLLLLNYATSVSKSSTI